LSHAGLRRLEEIALNSSSTPRQLLYDGWLIRLAPGKAKRPRSVNAFYASTLDLDEKLAHCAAVYREHGLPCIFRITPFVQPADLDAQLEARGWVAFDETLVQLAALGNGYRIREQVESVDLEPWLATYASLRPLSAREEHALREQLVSCVQRRLCLIARDGSDIVACGLGLIEGDALGLFNIATAEQARGRGHGSRVVEGLLAWGESALAARAYLQVNADNAPALATYRKFGFATAYTYRYRELR
jgi:ribosomal protein S18 acetylase RimI-like enzyme